MKTQPIDPCHYEMLGRGTTSSSSRIAVSMLPAAHRVGQAHAKPGHRMGSGQEESVAPEPGQPRA